MRILKQFWDRIFSTQRKTSVPDSQLVTRSEELECEISVISGERQALADEVQQVRSDFERAKDEENRKIADLDLVHQTLERARDEDHRKLTELESLNNRFETAREEDSRKILDLGTRLTELESEHDQAHDKVLALETHLSEANSRIDDTDNHVRELEGRLKSEHQNYLNIIRDMKSRFRKQDLRINWTMSIAGTVLLLGTVAGVILIWEMQKNTTLVSSMSKDLKRLMSSIDGNLSLQHKPREEKQQLSLPAKPPSAPRTKADTQPEKPRNSKKVKSTIDYLYGSEILNSTFGTESNNE